MKTRSLEQGEAPEVGEVVVSWSPKLAKGFRGRVARVGYYETPETTGIAVAILFDEGFVVVTDSRKLYVGGSGPMTFVPGCKPDMREMEHATIPGRDVPDPASVLENLSG